MAQMFGSSPCGRAFVASAMCVLLLSFCVAASEQTAAARPRMALTFDDLPNHGPLPPGTTRLDVAKSIIGTLKARNTPPVYGFINAKQLETSPADVEVLRLWREAGFPLGNHTFSHMDLHVNTPEDFERDVVANETTLQSLMAERDWHWFRYPYLREGNTPGKYRAVQGMLARHGYRVAQVTLSFDDYAYNDPYARCLARNDRDGLAWLEQSYRERAAASIVRGRDASRIWFGRDIDHVMLLHIGAFEMVMLPRLLEIIEQQGFALTTLEEAQKDAVYGTILDTGRVWSGSFLDQFAVATRRTPVSPSSDADVFAKLGALCR
jgi:peptidoglycan/xylan/chitin deacetylase (PgdA/CDA1 family)